MFYQAVQGIVYMEKELLALSEKNEELSTLSIELNKENGSLKEELAQAADQNKKDDGKLAVYEKHNLELNAELGSSLAKVAELDRQIA